jgi:S-formylglutathione hydrolase FrmB
MDLLLHMKTSSKVILTLIGASITYTTLAAKIDTIATYSLAMKKNIKAVVITPDNYSTKTCYPVVYLLHGFAGSYKDWAKNAKGFEAAADRYQMLIICPDGGKSSWYFDSPLDSTSKYETYIATELVNYVDGNYSTIRNRSGRAITGLSMGGHGALYLALKHQNIFGVAGSMSGGVDIRPFSGSWDISKRLGNYAQEPENWEKNTVINMLSMLSPRSLSLIIDCGTEDFFFKVNLELHERLLYLNIPHDYIARPGMHNWAYWSSAIAYHLMFMHNYFSGKP